MATNYTNNNYEVVTTKRSVPESSALTGTISTNGIAVVGVGTAFLTELPAGSWLVDLSASELRKVVRTDSNTAATLSQAFTANIPALTTGQAIHAKQTCVTEISLIIPLVDNAGNPNPFGEISGHNGMEEFPSGLPYVLSKSGRDDNSFQDFIDPVIVDGSGTTMLVSTLE